MKFSLSYEFETIISVLSFLAFITKSVHFFYPIVTLYPYICTYVVRGVGLVWQRVEDAEIGDLLKVFARASI